MMQMNIDGRTFMLNDAERRHWVNTGAVERRPEGDETDAEYAAWRDKIFADGAQRVYRAACPGGPGVDTSE